MLEKSKSPTLFMQQIKIGFICRTVEGIKELQYQWLFSNYEYVNKFSYETIIQSDHRTLILEWKCKNLCSDRCKLVRYSS